MDNLGTLLIYALITAFSFFVAAPISLNAISAFTVQKKFAEEMISKGIISSDHVKEMQGKKQLAGIIIAIIVIAALLFVALKNRPFGLICAIVGVAAGLLKFRNILEFNSLTVKRFQNTYTDMFDQDKLNEYIDKTF